MWANLVAKEASRRGRTPRTKTFSNNLPWLGPLIYFLSVAYFVVQFLVALVWTPAYNWLTNTISDLGNTSCRPQLCSPRHGLMNAEFWALGLIMAVGSLLIFQEFTERTDEERLAARIGFSCLAAGGVGAVLVGAFPENTVGFMHILGAGLAIFVGTLGILLIGLRVSLPLGLRWTMRILAPVAMMALILFAGHVYLGMGAGTMERIAAYPETVWLVIFGIYISATHYYSKGRRRTATRAAPPPLT